VTSLSEEDTNGTLTGGEKIGTDKSSKRVPIQEGKQGRRDMTFPALNIES